MREQRSFCRICIAMCGIVVTVDDDEATGASQVLKVRGDADHQLSRGYSCTKGRALPRYHHHPGRLDHPLVRDADGAKAGGAPHAVTWDEALDDVAAIIRRAVDEDGAATTALYLGSGAAFDAAGRSVSERFLRALGSAQKYSSLTVDTPCKPLVAEMVGGWSGLTATLDTAADGLVVLVGTNPVVSHGHSNGLSDPINRLRDVVARGGQLVVIDPRRTETATLVTSLGGTHLQPHPSTDWMIFAWLVRELLGGGGADLAYLDEHADAASLATLRSELASFPLDVVAEATGLEPGALTELLETIRTRRQLSVLTGTGLTMQYAANVTEWLVWTTQIVTGSLDREGGMWFNPGFLRQAHRFPPRAGGSTAAPGPASRPELASRFGERPAAALVSEIEAGNIRVLVVAGGSPFTAFPEPERFRRALQQLDALVVIDVVDNEMTAMATHVFPAADQLERADLPSVADNLQLAVASQFTPAVVAPSAERRPMWWMFAELARRLGLAPLLPEGKEPSATTDEDVLAELLRRAPFDLEQLKAAPSGTVVEHAVHGWVHDSVLPDGRWQLTPEALLAQLRALRPRPQGGNELLLTPRRQPATMNSQLRGVTVDAADGVRLHPDDAAAFGVTDGASVLIRSAHGEVDAIAVLDDRVRPGVLSMTHGWSAPHAGTLSSTTADVDLLTGMVCFSGVPVSVSPSSEGGS